MHGAYNVKVRMILVGDGNVRYAGTSKFATSSSSGTNTVTDDRAL
jgi:hypothetical protein